MQAASRPAKSSRVVDDDIAARFAALKAENDALRRQLDWFQRQLFGRKSEKRLIENPDQLGLAEVLGEAPAEAPAPQVRHSSSKNRPGFA